jgi:hypothetical protein
MPKEHFETRLRDFAIIVGLASAIQPNRMIFTIIVGLASDIERSIDHWNREASGGPIVSGLVGLETENRNPANLAQCQANPRIWLENIEIDL